MKHLKSILFIFFVFGATNWVSSQTNTFPSSGNVGIGTTSPSTALQIVSSGEAIRTYDGSNKLRMRLFETGPQYWYLNNGATDVGSIIFSVPGGNPGIVFFTGSSYNQNRFDLGNAKDFFYLGFDQDAASSGGALTVVKGGKVGIGTSNPMAKLSVNGKVESEEIQVIADVADYVFDESYSLMSLDDLEQYINANKCLPNIQNRFDVEANRGLVNLGELSISLMEKVEELTLHIIELNKKINELENKNSK